MNSKQGQIFIVKQKAFLVTYLLTAGCCVAEKGTSGGIICCMAPSFGVLTSPAPAGPGTAPDCMPVADL